jgi:MurNAc alpha-1-phosphate uridylyltransferase
VLSPEIVTGIRPGDKAPLGPVLVAAAARGAVTGELHQGVWRDIGTAERLAALQAMLGSTQ